MPIYEYRCEGCQRTVEQLSKMSDSDILRFDGCENGPCDLHKIFSVCAFKMGQVEYEPPAPFNPMSKPSITRDFMHPDGSITPMTQDEIARSPFIGYDA
jgi:putative FmdB family regulatory protein